MPWPWITGFLSSLLVAVGSALGGHGTPAPVAGAANQTAVRPAGQTPRRPNIVFVLTDDLSLDLLPYMPAVQALARRGASFSQYFVSDSLCCPSRASLFTGRFPHNTGIFTNVGPDGGFLRYHRRGEERRSFNLALQRAGYRTALMGKYLNGYLQRPRPYAIRSGQVSLSYVPPGWNEWDVAGNGYPEYGYELNHNGRVRRYGRRPQDYLTTVLTRLGDHFIDRTARTQRPFFLELATFAPHGPFTPAPQYAGTFPGLDAPRPPSFDALPAHPPSWLAGHPPLTAEQIARIDQAFRQRVESVQSIDDLLRSVQATLGRHHLLGRTIIVFSSDNGLHTGEYRLLPGKLTAYDTDIHVPLVFAGPGIAHRRISAVAQNTDLAETFADLAGIHFAGDGHALTALLRGQHPPAWRNTALVEHHGPDMDPLDPDVQMSDRGDPPTYEALRTPRLLYVEYRNSQRELYDLRRDPYELHNLAPRTSSRRMHRLHRALLGLRRCHGSAVCWRASHTDRGL